MSATKSKATPWWLSGPALVLFTVLLLVPLALTAVLSFNVYDPATGPKSGEFTLAHYALVFSDSYYLGIFFATVAVGYTMWLLIAVAGYVTVRAAIRSGIGTPYIDRLYPYASDTARAAISTAPANVGAFMSGAGAFVLLVGTHIVVVQLAFKQVVSTRKGLRHPRIWAALDFVVSTTSVIIGPLMVAPRLCPRPPGAVKRP